ncbi:cytidylate kinase family protein [Porphyromonas pogonae]|uniref:cytidylate kinase family protein n=1 Tax=Porphyromonas pogonae TaxID=867595 RepID=UPI002E760D83|nr:cytidylate kinase family protein [Porphyromonas pogonae]
MMKGRSTNELLRRYISFVISLFVVAFGTSLAIRANLGSSPISCPPYVLSCIPGARFTLGEYTFFMHIIFVVVQIIVLRRNYDPIQLLQLAVGLLFGVYTDFTMWLTAPLQWSNTILGYSLRWGQLALGGSILAFGIAWEVRCNVLMLAGEGFPAAFAKALKVDFGKIKIFTDTGLVLIGIAFCFAYLGRWHWELIGIGTLFSMFFVGAMVRVFAPRIGWLDVFMVDTKHPAQTISATHPANQWHTVVTISREYGSGGHEIGLKLAKKLGYSFYDSDIIRDTARLLGYSYEEVKETEQNISTPQLLELIFTGKEIPLSMSPSPADRIFVTESNLIRSHALKDNCVIVGRCADSVLKDNPHCFRVFVRCDEDKAIERVKTYEHLNDKEAREAIEKTNHARSNHYWQYTGKHWGNLDNYDLVINSTNISTDTAVRMIGEALKEDHKTTIAPVKTVLPVTAATPAVS